MSSPLFAEIQFGSHLGYNFTYSDLFKTIDSEKPANYEFGTGGLSGGFNLWYGKEFLWLGLDILHAPQYELGFSGDIEGYLSYFILSARIKAVTESGIFGGFDIGMANRFKHKYLRNSDGQKLSTGLFIGYSYAIWSSFRIGLNLRGLLIFDSNIIYSFIPSISLNYTY